MPVITRNQYKLMNEKAKLANKVKREKHAEQVQEEKYAKMKKLGPEDMVNMYYDNFVAETIKKLVDVMSSFETKQEQMKHCIKIFDTVNDYIFKTFNNTRIIDNRAFRWIGFVIAVYDKAVHFENQYHTGDFKELNKKMVKKFMNILLVTKNNAIEIIQSYDGEKYKDLVDKTKEKIASQKAAETTGSKQIELQSKTEEFLNNYEVVDSSSSWAISETKYPHKYIINIRTLNEKNGLYEEKTYYLNKV